MFSTSTRVSLSTIYRYCIVPLCKSTSIKTPGKVFVHLPNDPVLRKLWCTAIRRDPIRNRQLSVKSHRYICEDHFHLEEDMDNYMEWRMMGGHIRLKKGVLPHKFECQRRALNNLPDRSAAGKKRRGSLLASCAALGCTNGPGKNAQGVSYHTFPTDPELRAAWARACGRPKWKPTAKSALCSNHFSEDQIDRTHASNVRLRDGAVPNVFTATHAQKKSGAKALSQTAPAAASVLPFEPEIVIKEEPIDIDESQLPSTSRTADEFILPGPSRTGWTGHAPSLGEAFSVAKTPSNGKTEKKDEQSEKESEDDSKKAKDHFDAYGEYIAAKLRKLDWKSCAYVQKAIGDILFEAEMGKYK